MTWPAAVWCAVAGLACAGASDPDGGSAGPGGGAREGEAIAAIPPGPPRDRRRVALGRQLFFEPRLSGDGTVSCASATTRAAAAPTAAGWRWEWVERRAR